MAAMHRLFELDQKSSRASPRATASSVDVLWFLRTSKIKKAARRLPRCVSQKCLISFYHVFSGLVAKTQKRKLVRFRLARHPPRICIGLQTGVSFCHARLLES